MSLSARHQHRCIGFLLVSLFAFVAGAHAGPVVHDLHDFQGSDGANPIGELVLGSDGLYYGTTRTGGDNDLGTVFSIDADGNLTTLHDFGAAGDGAQPEGPLVELGHGQFYGTTSAGGANNVGTIFRIATTGDYSVLVNLAARTGARPHAGLVYKAGRFYGTASAGGQFGKGVVFKVAPTGVYRVMHHFNGTDGATPLAELLEDDGIFYGTTSKGGSADQGTVFSITNAGDFTSVYSFAGGQDGASPSAAFALGPDGKLYSTTAARGVNSGSCPRGCGTVFRLKPPDSIETLHRFDFFHGSKPLSSLTAAGDGMLYGITQQGGDGCFFLELDLGCGVAYRIDTDGNFEQFYSFDYGRTYPETGLIVGTNGFLYGTATYSALRGADAGFGALYSIEPTPTTITGFSPPQGPVGTTVTLTGTNFTPVFSVAFHGVPATFTIDSPTQITTTVPAGATSGPIVVQAPNGSASSGNFSVTIPGVTLTTLHTFIFEQDGTNSPIDKLILGSDGALWSTVLGSGSDGGGIYRITTDGSFTMLQSFPIVGPNQFPWGGLVLGNDGNYYGTTEYGGAGGSVFSLTPANVFTSLYNFTGGGDGSTPRHDGLIQASNDAYYGTTESGGLTSPGTCRFGCGTIFRFVPGQNAVAIHQFDGNNGNGPRAGVIEGSDHRLYGTTNSGGAHGAGVVFRIGLNGANFTVLHHFDRSEGGFPLGSLLQASDGNFYGTANVGGDNDKGVVYRITPSGVFTVLHAFGGLDGIHPDAALIQASDGALYGETEGGGAYNWGTIYRITLDGVFTTYHDFKGSDGSSPEAALYQASDGNLYGTTRQGGGFDCIPGFIECGTIFRLTLPH